MPYKDPQKRAEFHKRYGADWRKANQERIKKNSEAYYERTKTDLHIRYLHCITTARKRNLEWSISEEDYQKLVSIPCDYCNGQFGQVTTGVGLDRKDNTKGYTLENSVSCCGWCNKLKSDQLSYTEMKSVVGLIIEMRTE